MPEHNKVFALRLNNTSFRLRQCNAYTFRFFFLLRPIFPRLHNPGDFKRNLSIVVHFIHAFSSRIELQQRSTNRRMHLIISEKFVWFDNNNNCYSTIFLSSYVWQVGSARASTRIFRRSLVKRMDYHGIIVFQIRSKRIETKIKWD